MLQQIKMLVLGIITLCRRALCCFSRRRKLSHSGSSSGSGDLQAVNVIVERGEFSATPGANPTGGRATAGPKERDWNSWDDSPRTVEEHIEQYRQRMAQPPTPPKEEPEPDFFSELTPTIKPQLKFYLEDPTTNAASSQPSDFSRLQAQDLVPISNNADLEDWVDDNAGGWEELDTSQTKQILREKRRELRHQRQPAARPAPPTVGAQRLTEGQRAA